MPSWSNDPSSWPPVAERPRQHWLVEQRLREELLASSPVDRERITRDVYNRLFDEVPWHDANATDSNIEDAYEEHWFQLYGPLTRPDDVLLDIGCGRGGLVNRFARAVSQAIGLDASDAMIAIAEKSKPANVRFIVGNLLTPPVPPKSVDFVVSRQLMEHLHPADVPEHLRAVFETLRPGGRFLIETPSRLTGPWDISRGFTDIASGFHLREYTNREMGAMLRDAGFRRVRGPAVPARVLARLGSGNRRAYMPVQVKSGIEAVLRIAPMKIRPKLAGPLLVRDVTLVAERP